MTRLSHAEQDELEWFKATASVPGGYCVEVARHPEGVAMRHSRSPDDGALLYTRDEFAAFLEGAKSSEFDHIVEVPTQRGTSRES